MAEKIKNVENKIKERKEELDIDELELPEACPGDDRKPSLSRRGHKKLINMDKENLAALTAKYLALCADWGPPTPPPLPIPNPDPVTQGQGTANATGSLFIILLGVLVFAL